MDKSDMTKSFEAFFKTHNDKKPLALYYAKEKSSTSLPSNILKSQDVIARVSNQLREIQKADYLKKEFKRHVEKSRQADFLPINVLYSQESYQNENVPKFQTQCVSDTQLINIVNNVEAMVNMNMEHQTDSNYKQDNIEENVCERHIVNFGSRDNNCTTENNLKNKLEDVKHFCYQEGELCIDEINTDIYKEFNTSYSGTHDDNDCLQNSYKERSIHQYNENSPRINIIDSIENSTVQNCEDHLKCNDDKYEISTQVTDVTTRKPFKDKYNELIEKNTGEQKKENRVAQNNNNTVEVDCHLKNNFLDRCITDTNMEHDCDLCEKEKVPSSPVLKSFKSIIKSKTLSPLIFPLDSFEKFESLAMPLMKENLDLECTKRLINSQIIDNQLLITVNEVPVLENSTGNLKVLNNDDANKMLEIVSNKNAYMDSKQVEYKSTSFDEEILFNSDEENDYIQYDEKELAPTCALKTSFNDSEVDLDETVFVGFQTCSDKCIQVTRDSFIRAKNLLNTIDKEKNVNMTFTELVDIYDSRASLCHNSLSTKQHSGVDSDKDYKEVNNFTKDISRTNATNSENIKISEKAAFIGFKTANGKPIAISESALLKGNAIFSDIEGDNSGTLEVLNPVPKKKKIEGRKIANDKIIKISNNLNVDLNLNTAYQKHVQAVETRNTADCIHFFDKTKRDTNNDYVNIGDQTLLQEFEDESIEEAIEDHKQAECNALEIHKDFTDIEIKDKKSRGSPRDGKNDQSFYDINRIIDSDVREKHDSRISGYHYSKTTYLQKTPEFFGFKTANNKEIKISMQALAKTKDLFQDHGFEDLNNLEKEPNHKFEECHINNDKSGSKSASNNDRIIRASETKIRQTESSNEICQGFKTASNKGVHISKEALLKSEQLFKDVNSFIISTDKKEVKTDNKLNNINTNYSSLSFQGFKTASNKSVNVAKEAIARSKKIFEDIFNVNNIETRSSDIYNSYTRKPTMLNNESVCKEVTSCVKKVDRDENKFINKIKTNKLTRLPGRNTVSDKEIVISEEVTNADKVSEDIACENICFQNKQGNEKVDHKKKDFKNHAKNTSRSDEQKHDIQAFTGFQTASNKCVKISYEAIARSRKIFDEVNFDVQSNNDEHKRKLSFSHEDTIKDNIEQECKKEKVPPAFEFKTATNKRITVSEDALKRSKQLFFDIDNDLKKPESRVNQLRFKNESVIDLENNLNFHNTMDTQLFNNFEETLHTEDFYKDVTPKRSKRSASPILSCPKAKKRRKFETPYRSDISTAKIQNNFCRANKKSNVTYTFSEYKKTKLYSLNDLHNDNVYKNNVIDPYILNFDFDSLLKFQFDGSRNDVTGVIWTTDNIKTCFIESVDNKIIPDGWLDNHLKLILWKLISYDVRFPNTMRGVCSVKNVLEQLKYRYDKELHRVERPALRKLLEKDEISSRTMILAVVGVYVDGVKMISAPNSSQTVELLVTDGWYCVLACTDRMISRLVSEGKIAVGRKIATVGAELLNCEQGVSPWEDTSAVRLKLFGNSTRPAHWDARLGFHSNGSILSQLSTIDPSGGKVYKTRAFVVRVYPALYVEKLEDGSTVTRSERLEHLHQIKYESERQIQLEKLYEEVEKEFYDQESSESEGMDTDTKKSHQSGSQLNRIMKKCNDPTQYRSHLSDSQALLLQEYTSRKKEKIVEDLQKRVQEKIQARGLQISRNVIPLLKIRVAGFAEADSVIVSKAMVSIWRPNDEILDVITEGAWIDMFNVFPTAIRNSEIQISAGRQSVFHRSKYKSKDNVKPYIESLQRKCFTVKELNSNPTMHSEFNEIDTVGIVFLIEPSLNDFETSKGQQFQNVYLTDVDKNFICINFWGGIKKFGFQNIFDTGNVVACMNLQKRAGNTRKNIPQYRATELSVFTKTPKLDHVRYITAELNKKITGFDKKKFYDDCIVIKNNYSVIKYSSEFSPYRFNTSDYSLMKNKMFIDSPLAQTKDVNLNLSGLDFESTFQQADTQEMSSSMVKRKQLVKEKIAKLQMYGEPPPLSKIHIVNKSKYADSAYKSPLTRNVTRAKNIDSNPISTNKLSVQDSPNLALNRTYIRSGVNPVKLKFLASDISDNKEELNPFEEDFEASPPLSLE